MRTFISRWPLVVVAVLALALTFQLVDSEQASAHAVLERYLFRTYHGRTRKDSPWQPLAFT